MMDLKEEQLTVKNYSVIARIRQNSTSSDQILPCVSAVCVSRKEIDVNVNVNLRLSFRFCVYSGHQILCTLILANRMASAWVHTRCIHWMGEGVFNISQALHECELALHELGHRLDWQW